MKPRSAIPFSLSLPAPPEASLRVVTERIAEDAGFLGRRTRRLAATPRGGVLGEEFVYDDVVRRALDAVVVVPYTYLAEGDERRLYVLLRSALRPPVALRPPLGGMKDVPAGGTLWEVPAGLVEPEEATVEGVVAAARRELLEETGFRVELSELRSLGAPSYPCPGVIGEAHYFFAVEVAPAQQTEPELDGSPLESLGELIFVPLSVALAECRAGRLADAKTELALRRLAEELS